MQQKSKGDIRVVKRTLNKVCKDDDLKKFIKEKVIQIHLLKTETLHLIGLDIRQRYGAADAIKRTSKENIDPSVLALAYEAMEENPWTQERVMIFLKAVSNCKGEKRAKEGSSLENLQISRSKIYDPLRQESRLELVRRDNLPCNLLQEISTTIATSINNNIKLHFFKRQLKYLCIRYGYEKKEAQKIANSINEKKGETHEETLPFYIEKSVAYDLEVYPEKFLLPMWCMNSYYEENGLKTFALMPLTNGWIPSSSFYMDTATLEKWAKSNKKDINYYEDVQKERIESKGRSPPGRIMEDIVMNEKSILWNKFFDFEHLIKRKREKHGIRFGHHITTDGLSISINLDYSSIHRKNQEVIKTSLKDLNPDNSNNDIIMEDINQESKKRKNKSKPNKKNNRKKETIVKESKLEETTKNFKSRFEKKKETKEIQKLNDEIIIEKIRNNKDYYLSKIVGVDPGKYDIVHMTNESSPFDDEDFEKKTLRYTSKQRRHESGSIRRARDIEGRKPDEIRELESELSKTNSRSSTLESFSKYLLARFKVQEKLYAYYSDIYFRACRWLNWKHTRSSEDRFINKVIQTFGKDCILAYGCWGTWNGMKGCAPSPTTGFKKRLADKITVITVPEYNTSKTCSKCKGKLKEDPDRKMITKSGILKPIRGIRRCNSVHCGGLLRWNRDHNAAINIRSQLLYKIEYGSYNPNFLPTPEDKRLDIISSEGEAAEESVLMF